MSQIRYVIFHSRQGKYYENNYYSNLEIQRDMNSFPLEHVASKILPKINYTIFYIKSPFYLYSLGYAKHLENKCIPERK